MRKPATTSAEVPSSALPLAGRGQDVVDIPAGQRKSHRAQHPPCQPRRRRLQDRPQVVVSYVGNLRESGRATGRAGEAGDRAEDTDDMAIRRLASQRARRPAVSAAAIGRPARGRGLLGRPVRATVR
jgi:hypothetical protein